MTALGNNTKKNRGGCTHVSTSSLVRLSRAVLLLCLGFVCSATARGSTADCSAGTLVTVVAHLDDDLLFVEPAISERLRAGWCVTTVHLIGGANGANFAYVQKREEGSRLAYARAAGVPNAWDESTLKIAGQPVYQLTLKAQPRVRLLELRLPGGAVRGGRVPLALLWDQGATLTTYPMGRGELPAARYTRDSLSAVLREILQDATSIATLNPDTVPFIEHPDHIYAARITRHLAQTLDRSLPIGYYTTYPTGNWPTTLFGDTAQRKRDLAASYFSVDGGDVAHVFGEYQWDGNWVLRNYVRNDTNRHKVQDFVALPSVLFNAGSNQCLTSTGAGRAPALSPCDDSVGQQWIWEPRASYAGNQHNAALVSASTGLCVGEHDGALAEEPCEEWKAAQRWTPWDFGLIFTPSRRCLGEEHNRLHIRGCASLTTRYRWSAARPTRATDLRLAGAMYGDVAGQGSPSAVYVQRRPDGPGFDIYVQTSILQLSETPDNWYSNAVRFDSHATEPTCNADTLCFDSARFLVGDFDGDGRADLMVATPRHGGTAFWLLKSNGSRFLEPTLWFQSDDNISADHAQQYVSFATAESPSEKILIAVLRSDNAVELWTVGADRDGHIQQTKVPGAHRFTSDVQILSLRSDRQRFTPFVAVESADKSRRMTVTQFGFDSGHWSIGETALLPPLFKRDTTRITNDAGAEMSVVIAVPHLAGPGGVDVWKWSVARPASEPVFMKYLREIRWQDAAPTVVRDAKGTALFFYERADAILTNTLFTSGNATLVRYPFNGNDIQGMPTGSFALPAVYSESLWLERLFQ
ncbi:RICIN domain-containing protein [Paraburkholderia phymatum]|uniref:FG-GAP repeat protein n=1 Tax=Paraburkholderia phymatum (strain DSM 17167 / CIP 108236 / LMG 21445 / STM815) TaxID=391038 RepID=B2JT23_PARP8|nr:RICIN domain-containing protein [Paraburkholderia phymatum]ACC75726.1 FG-GAP repeat protein [Paraburkholderia phymatum STM815]